MRIAIITFGGYGCYPQHFISSMLEKDKNLLVLAPDYMKGDFTELEVNDERFVFFKKPRMRYPTNVLMIMSIVKTIEKFRPDVVHITGYFPWMILGLKRLSKCPLVLTVHDPIKHSGDIETKIVPGSDRMFYKYMSQIIVLGDEMKKIISSNNWINDSRINVILHGNSNKFLKWSQTNTQEAGNKVLFFGRIFKYKGLETLINAEPAVYNKIPNVEFIVAGSGSKKYIEKIKEGIVHSDRFTFISEYVSNEDAARLFQECSLVVLPYVDGTQSGPLLLSYAFKKPVVVTSVGSLPEYVADGITGYIVPPCDSDKLAERIIDLLKNDQRRKKMGESAYKMSVEKLCWNKLSEKYLKVYQKAQASS